MFKSLKYTYIAHLGNHLFVKISGAIKRTRNDDSSNSFRRK